MTRGERRREEQQAYYAKNKEAIRRKQRAYEIKISYGVTPEEYEECMSTSTTCEKCGTMEDLCYDHCHIEGSGVEAFRGVLCRSCNRSIGALGDSVEGLEEALAYLRKYYV